MSKKEVPICMKLYLTIEEAMVYTNIGESTLRKYLKKHEEELVIRVGRKILVKRKKLEEFLLAETEL